MYIKSLTLILVLLGELSYCYHVESKPICSVYTPNSILQKKEQYVPYFIGGRSRYATCTGAAWFHENYFAVLNLYGANIRTYKWDAVCNRCTMVQEVNNKDGMRLFQPENLTVSPDGRLLAVCNAQTSNIELHTIDVDTHLIDPKAIFSLNASGLVHNVRFTSDGKYFAYVTFNNNEEIAICEVHNDKKCNLTRVYQQINQFPNMRAKGINFTKNNRFAAVCYANCATGQSGTINKGLVVVYAFDNSNGTLSDPICIINTPELGGPEDIALLYDDHAIIVSNQANDTLVILPFNPETGQIGEGDVVLQNPQSQLSFPHGMSVSQDGKYLVVTNYGDDKFNIYRIG